jgi:hypothetical protein
MMTQPTDAGHRDETPATTTTTTEHRPHWKLVNALGLPAGSVRALLALMIFGGIWYWMWRSPDREVPGFLRDLMFIILGHYFAARQARRNADGPSPLYLPRGTIRLALVAGFAVLAVAVYRRDGFRVNDAWMTLTLVGGFMLGVLTTSALRGRRLPRAVEDARALVSLAAGVTLILLMFNLWRLPPEWAPFQQYLVKYKVEDVLAAVVGFYFGSKS